MRGGVGALQGSSVPVRQVKSVDIELVVNQLPESGWPHSKVSQIHITSRPHRPHVWAGIGSQREPKVVVSVC